MWATLVYPPSCRALARTLPRTFRVLAGIPDERSAGEMRSDLRFWGGRYGTRTHDLCRVNEGEGFAAVQVRGSK